jgi:hypothetical protein
MKVEVRVQPMKRDLHASSASEPSHLGRCAPIPMQPLAGVWRGNASGQTWRSSTDWHMSGRLNYGSGLSCHATVLVGFLGSWHPKSGVASMTLVGIWQCWCGVWCCEIGPSFADELSLTEGNRGKFGYQLIALGEDNMSFKIERGFELMVENYC